MSQMWEVVHQLAAKAGLPMALSRPMDAHRKGPWVAPPEESPAVQSESDPRLRGEPLLDNNAPGPSCCPPWSAPAQPAALASSGALSSALAPSAPAPTAPDPPAPALPDPAPPAPASVA